MPAFGRTGSVGRERTFWIAAEPEQSGSVTSAATMPRQTTPARRAPSPLKRERAGVRGETEPSPPEFKKPAIVPSEPTHRCGESASANPP